MIAFGCSVSEPEPYLRYAEPGIRLAAEPDSEIFPFAAVGTIGRSYNLLLDAAAAHDDLEALVIVHPHVEIADMHLCQKVRHALRDPQVAVVGCAGAAGVCSIAWWEGSVSSGPVIHRYSEHGGGEFPGFSWTTSEAAPAEVDTVDGFLLVLSPWAVRNLRFDEGLMLGHGFDLDFCLQVRSAGRTVATADLRVIQHRSLEIISDLELWVEAHIEVAKKWRDRMPGADARAGTWKQRARRAEAEREAARAIAYSRRLSFDARVEELERSLDEAIGTISWRITQPLRRLNKWRRDTVAARRKQLQS
jgi:Glycosyltransferase like family